MTKSDFRFAMQRGLGRCILALESSHDIELYREAILRGCLKEASFDTQCEGTRARYLYELASYYNDDAYFVEPLSAALKKMRSTGGWLFLQYCEILSCFAEAGNAAARTALYEKYDVLYQKLRRSHRGSNARAYMREDFESLCIVLTSLDGLDRFVSIAADMGALLEKAGFTGVDFLWFVDNGKLKFGEKRLTNRLLKEAKNAESLARSCARIEAPDRRKARPELAPVLTADELFSAASDASLSAAQKVKFRRRASDEEKKKLAEYAIACDTVSVKTTLLSVFEGAVFPVPCHAMLAYAHAEDVPLRASAIHALEKCRWEEVRGLAFELLPKKEYRASALCMLVTNYQKNDKKLLLKALYAYPVTYSNSNGWHDIVRHILWAFEQDAHRALPEELLNYVYKYSLCSCCREFAVRALARRKWLTMDIVNECLHDSNEDIRAYAARVYRTKSGSATARLPRRRQTPDN